MYVYFFPTSDLALVLKYNKCCYNGVYYIIIILYQRKAFILARINFLNEKIDALKKENELEEEKNKEKNKEILFKFNRLCKFKGEEIEMIFSEELQKLTNQEIDFLKKEIGDAFIQKM